MATEENEENSQNLKSDFTRLFYSFINTGTTDDDDDDDE